MKEDITATIQVSRKTDIRSIAHDLLSEKTELSQQPKALFLFTTIHYKNEFTDILSTIKNEFSDVPLIGGTVSDFMSHKGCFT